MVFFNEIQWKYLFFSSIVSLLTLVFYMMRNNNYWKKKGVTYLKPKPVFGNAFYMFTWRQNMGSFFREIYEKYKQPYIGIFLLDHPCLVINDLNLTKQFLVKDFENFQNRSMANSPKNEPICSKMIFFSQIPFWSEYRKVFSPLFSTEKLRFQTECLITTSVQLIEAMKTMISKGKNKFDIRIFSDKFAVNSVTTAFFNSENDCFLDENSPFLAMSKKIMNWKQKLHALQTCYMFIAPKIYHFLGLKFMDDDSIKFFRKLSEDLLKTRGNNYVIDVLLRKENKDKISEEGLDILSSYLSQIFVIYELISTHMSLSLFELAKNPHCQRLAREEVRKIWKMEKEFTYANILSAKYLKNCLFETLRMYPNEPFLDRSCTRDYKIPGTDVVLEKGTAVYFPIWGIHHDEKYYRIPFQFDPDRFTEENIRKRPDFTFLAFGKGQRRCPGERFAILNTTIGLAHILLNFEIKLPDGTARDMEFVKMGNLLQPQHQICLEFIEINI